MRSGRLIVYGNQIRFDEMDKLRERAYDLKPSELEELTLEVDISPGRLSGEDYLSKKCYVCCSGLVSRKQCSLT